MSEVDIENPADSERIKRILQEGKQSEFWAVICQQLNKTKEQVSAVMNGTNIVTLPADEYKVMNEIHKNRIFDLTDLQDIPDTLIMDLSKPDEDREPAFLRDGIYHTAKDFLPDEE